MIEEAIAVFAAHSNFGDTASKSADLFGASQAGGIDPSFAESYSVG